MIVRHIELCKYLINFPNSSRLEGDGEVKIVTELPKEMFNKRTLQDYSSSSSSCPSQFCSEESKDNLYRPVFSKRQKTNNAMSSGKN